MSYIKNVCLLICFIGAAQCAVAQEDLPTGEVDVVKNFEARLADAERVVVAPELPRLDTSTRRLQYNVLSKHVPVEYLPPKIRPLAFRTEKPQDVYGGYARIGAGFPSAFLGELTYDITKNADFDLGFHLKRHTANNNKNVENQRFSNNELGLDASYYLDNGVAVKGEVNYQNNGVYYYGYNDLNDELSADTTTYSFTPEEVRQRFTIFDLGIDIFNGVRTVGDFNYKAGVDFYFLNDEYAAKENGFLLTLEGRKWFNEKHPLALVLKTDFSTFRSEGEKQQLNNFYLQPSYTYHAEAFQVKLGANITSHNDDFSVFPDIEASANVVPGIVTAFIGATGTLQKNSLRNHLEYNPFLRTRPEIKNASFNEFYGGVKGNIVGATYHAQIGYKKVNNLALYQLENPIDSILRFGVLYDTASVVTIKGTVVVPLFEGLEVTGSLAQNIYSLEREEKPWHLPSFTVNAGARYTTPSRQFALRADLFLENGVPYKDALGETQNLNALFDVNVMGEYFFSENFGAFLQLNNLASNNRQRWFRYPTMGINILAGVSARF